MKKFFIMICILLCSSKLFAAPVNEIIFFGDSLSDDGNLYSILKVIPRSPPYYKGRFSNGPTWAELLGNHYKDANHLDSSNYAYGGATAYSHDSGNLFAPMTLNAEVLEYYALTLFKDKSDKLYVIWIGGNDYLTEEEMDPEALTEKVIESIFSAINDLKSKGGQYFLILNLPDLARTPYAAENNLTQRLHLLTTMHNTKLAKALAEYAAANPEQKTILVDVYSFFDDLLAHPDQYNQKYQTQLSNLHQACWTGGLTLQSLQTGSQNTPRFHLQAQLLEQNNSALKKYNIRTLSEEILSSPSLKETYRVASIKDNGLDPCKQPEQYIFWDLIHPTAPVHQILAFRVLDTLEREAKDLLAG